MTREDRYRVWCEECEWESTAPTQEAASALMHLVHGVKTGHSETYLEEIEK